MINVNETVTALVCVLRLTPIDLEHLTPYLRRRLGCLLHPGNYEAQPIGVLGIVHKEPVPLYPEGSPSGDNQPP